MEINANLTTCACRFVAIVEMGLTKAYVHIDQNAGLLHQMGVEEAAVATKEMVGVEMEMEEAAVERAEH